MSAFGCKITDADMVRACAPEQPERVAVGQEWMDVETGSILPVKAIQGDHISLGGSSYTHVLTEKLLRREFVCTDPPDNVTELVR